ncbi:unnamed protein product [Cercospora beticola]|nr:unnamed protein product [Cercospora beticola]
MREQSRISEHDAKERCKPSVKKEHSSHLPESEVAFKKEDPWVEQMVASWRRRRGWSSVLANSKTLRGSGFSLVSGDPVPRAKLDELCCCCFVLAFSLQASNCSCCSVPPRCR